jgi:hypothetical protein
VIAARLLAALALALSAGGADGGRDAGDAALEERRVELAAAAWTRNGIAVTDALIEPGATADAPPAARLPFPQRGVRWATEFTTEAPGTARLVLDYAPGPDGLLFEVVLDGTRLSPPRDGWRPTPRAVAADLGAAWLGRGAHLLEFVAREEAPEAALHVRALRLLPP